MVSRKITPGRNYFGMRTMRILALQNIARTGLFAVLIGFGAGCATQTKTGKKAYEFYPPPPDEPHLQFLTAFSSEKEFRGKEDKNLMTFLTGVQPAAKEIGKPYGGAGSGGKLFICDTEVQAVVVADLQTRRFAALDAQGEGALKQPQNITFDSDGLCYVTDTGRQQVVIFDKNKNYLATLGKKDELKPLDVAVSKDKIYVADLMKHSVRVFDKTSRTLVRQIPSIEEAPKIAQLQKEISAIEAKAKLQGETSKEDLKALNEKSAELNSKGPLYTPTNLALDSKGRLYVSDSGAFRVQVYDSEGKYIRSIGEMGKGLGQFGRVKGIAVDRQDRLYAVDALSQATQIFNEEGRLLTWFTEPEGASRVQNLPAKIFLDYDDVSYFKSYAAPNFELEYLAVIINQLGSHKVSVYGFGHKK